MTYNEFRNLRINFLEEHGRKDHVLLKGTSNILISAPHTVSQVRLGKRKPAEIGTLSVALALHKFSNTFMIAKTKNNYDDANFDQVSSYKDSIDDLVMKHKIDYIIDLHGLAASRPMDINLGINLGHNVETNTKLFDTLKSMLKNDGFVVTVDQPFSGGSNTIAGSSKSKHQNLWTIQIEINCAITNKRENFSKNKKLLNVLTNFIKLLEIQN